MKRNKNLMKNIARGLVTSVIGVMTAFSLAACAVESDAEIIREGLSEELESIKNIDQEVLDGIEDSLGMDIEEYGITIEELCSAWLDGFDYSIDSVITVNDTGTATVTISCRPLFEAMNTWYEDTLYNSDIYSMSTEELYAYVGTSLIEAIKSTEVVTTVVELPYELVGDTWYEADGFSEAIYVALYGEE